MPVAVEMHNVDADVQRDVVAVIEHLFSSQSGNWRVLIVGSQESDGWEMTIFGPNGFERSYTLDKSCGEHNPQRIVALINTIVSS